MNKEKAEAYDKLLVKAKQIYNKENDVLIIHTLEDLFPELKESEDEKIRKELIFFLQSYDTLLTQKFIAWLEKQNGQKIALPKWKYKKDPTPLLRDSIILNKYGCVAKLSSGAIVSDVWVLDYNELAKLPKEELEKQGEQETLCDKCKQQQPSHSCQDITALGRCAVEHEQKPVEWSEEDKRIILAISKLLKDCASENGWNCVYYNDREVFFADIENYLQSLKNRIAPHPEQEWSKEDEEMFKSLKTLLDNASCHSCTEGVDKILSWLKSLKPQKQWKPSKEQMDALNNARWNAPFNIEILDSLYNDLKKLKGE